MGQRPTRLRITALLLVAVYAIHQIRMAVDSGDAGGSAGSSTHRYLPLLAGVAAALGLLAAAQFVLTVRSSHRRSGRARTMKRMTTAATTNHATATTIAPL